MAKITQTFVREVKAPSESYELHWDGGYDRAVKGYGLRVSAPSKQYPTGKRVYVAHGRVRGRQVNLTLGPIGEMTEAEARDKARRVLQRMREGIDPRDERKQDEAMKVTLRQVADSYMGRVGKLKESSAAQIERHVTTTLAHWEHKPILSITEDGCRQLYRKLMTKGLRGDRKQGSPGQANQSLSILKALLNYASRQYRRADGSPIIASNPVDALRDDWVELKPRTGRIPDNRVGAVWSALKEWRAEAYTRDSLAGIDLVMFLLLTGCRLNEAASLRWEQVNIEDDPAACWWHLPDPKNRNPFWFPCSTQLVDLLKTRERFEGSPWVFTTWSKSGHIVSPRELLKKVSKVAGTKVTNHDLRRTTINIGVGQCGMDFYKIELLTGHLPKTVTARHYLETERLAYLYPEAQRIADWIEAEAAKASGANVVAMRA
ncbi:MAG: integrase family protein [Paracoccaceae bacterium]|nr:integrase family protein [Paracoccaceae bacterium]